MGEFGSAPRFVSAVREGRLRILDATCPAIYAALQAGQKGIPFIPLRGLIGSDVLANRPDWKVIDNPFQAGDPIVVLPAIRPDVALFHAPLADRYGNVFIGRARELLTMAHAARETLVTVEEFTDRDLMDDPDRSPGVLPALYVTRIAQAVRGAWPLRLGDEYGMDEPALARYVAAAQTEAGFQRFLSEWLDEPAPAGAVA
jgi:glutaconate CoA-transferase subunit A